MPVKAKAAEPQSRPEVFQRNQVVQVEVVQSHFVPVAVMKASRNESLIQTVRVKGRIVTKQPDKNQRARAFSVNREDRQEGHIHPLQEEMIVRKDSNVKENEQKDQPLNVLPEDHPAEIFQVQVVVEIDRKEVNKKVIIQK